MLCVPYTVTMKHTETHLLIRLLMLAFYYLHGVHHIAGCTNLFSHAHLKCYWKFWIRTSESQVKGLINRCIICIGYKVCKSIFCKSTWQSSLYECNNLWGCCCLCFSLPAPPSPPAEVWREYLQVYLDEHSFSYIYLIWRGNLRTQYFLEKLFPHSAVFLIFKENI